MALNVLAPRESDMIYLDQDHDPRNPPQTPTPTQPQTDPTFINALAHEIHRHLATDHKIVTNNHIIITPGEHLHINSTKETNTHIEHTHIHPGPTITNNKLIITHKGNSLELHQICGGQVTIIERNAQSAITTPYDYDLLIKTYDLNDPHSLDTLLADIKRLIDKP